MSFGALFLKFTGGILRGELIGVLFRGALLCLFSHCHFLFCIVLISSHFSSVSHFLYKSSATDVSAQATMKGVAKCDKHFELQSSVSQQNLERTLRSQEIPESTPASVPTAFATS